MKRFKTARCCTGAKHMLWWCFEAFVKKKVMFRIKLIDIRKFNHWSIAWICSWKVISPIASTSAATLSGPVAWDAASSRDFWSSNFWKAFASIFGMAASSTCVAAVTCWAVMSGLLSFLPSSSGDGFLPGSGSQCVRHPLWRRPNTPAPHHSGCSCPDEAFFLYQKCRSCQISLKDSMAKGKPRLMCVSGDCSQTFLTPAILPLSASKWQLGVSIIIDELCWLTIIFQHVWDWFLKTWVSDGDHFSSIRSSLSANQPSVRVIFTFIFFLITSSSCVKKSSWDKLPVGRIPKNIVSPMVLKLAHQVYIVWSLLQFVSIKSWAISFFSSVPFSHWVFTISGTWRSDRFFFGAIMRLMRILAAFCNSSWRNRGCWAAMLV